MDRIMVRISSGKGTSNSRFARGLTSISASQPASHTSFTFQSFVYLLVALCGVFLIAHFLFSSSESSRALRSSLRSVPAEAILQAQLVEKEKEIEKLRWEIEQIRKGVDSKDWSISEKETLIQRLKSRATLEHEAKTKAELALSDRASALYQCQEQKTALAGEVAQCHYDLKALLSGESHRVSAQSTAYIGNMERRGQEAHAQDGQQQVGVFA